ncbi:unnamed protein product [Prunus brigantina]
MLSCTAFLLLCYKGIVSFLYNSFMLLGYSLLFFSIVLSLSLSWVVSAILSFLSFSWVVSCLLFSLPLLPTFSF